MEESSGKSTCFMFFLLLFFIFPPLGIMFVIIFCAYSDNDTGISHPILFEDVPGQVNHKKNLTTLCYIDSYGYYRFHDSNKLFHRWVMEKELGRELDSNEIVHHKDGNKKNNYPSNLIVCTQEEHDKIHRDNIRKYNSWYEPSLS